LSTKDQLKIQVDKALSPVEYSNYAMVHSLHPDKLDNAHYQFHHHHHHDQVLNHYQQDYSIQFHRDREVELKISKANHDNHKVSSL